MFAIFFLSNMVSSPAIFNLHKTSRLLVCNMASDYENDCCMCEPVLLIALINMVLLH